jgi:uncharacterized protein
MPVPEHTIHYLEIVTPDVAATRASYEQAFGWRFQETGPELGNSLVAELPNGSRCGIRAPMHGAEKPIVRTYLRVADIDLAASRLETLGATFGLPPTAFPPYGKLAIYFIGGIEQGLWQVP